MKIFRNFFDHFMRRFFLKVSLEMAVRVLTVVLGWCAPIKRHAYMRSIEHSAALLTSRGHITGAEARYIEKGENCGSLRDIVACDTTANVQAPLGNSPPADGMANKVVPGNCTTNATRRGYVPIR